jgi:hypothetical protein
MYNFNDIDALIRNGEDPEAIAKAFTSRLNEAINANSRDKEREEAGHAFADAWNDLMDLWLENNDVPDGIDKEDLFFDCPTALEAFDGIMNMIVKTAPLMNLLSKMVDEEESKPMSKVCKKPTDNSFDKVMRGFLSEIL